MNIDKKVIKPKKEKKINDKTKLVPEVAEVAKTEDDNSKDLLFDLYLTTEELLRAELASEKTKHLKTNKQYKILEIKNLEWEIRNIQVKIIKVKNEAKAIEDKLKDISEDHQKMLRGITEKYKLPIQWGYDDENGKITILDENNNNN